MNQIIEIDGNKYNRRNLFFTINKIGTVFLCKTTPQGHEKIKQITVKDQLVLAIKITTFVEDENGKIIKSKIEFNEDIQNEETKN
jgi:hypothetical protein